MLSRVRSRGRPGVIVAALAVLATSSLVILGARAAPAAPTTLPLPMRCSVPLSPHEEVTPVPITTDYSGSLNPGGEVTLSISLPLRRLVEVLPPDATVTKVTWRQPIPGPSLDERQRFDVRARSGDLEVTSRRYLDGVTFTAAGSTPVGELDTMEVDLTVTLTTGIGGGNVLWDPPVVTVEADSPSGAITQECLPDSFPFPLRIASMPIGPDPVLVTTSQPNYECAYSDLPPRITWPLLVRGVQRPEVARPGEAATAVVKTSFNWLFANLLSRGGRITEIEVTFPVPSHLDGDEPVTVTAVGGSATGTSRRVGETVVLTLTGGGDASPYLTPELHLTGTLRPITGGTNLNWPAPSTIAITATLPSRPDPVTATCTEQSDVTVATGVVAAEETPATDTTSTTTTTTTTTTTSTSTTTTTSTVPKTSTTSRRVTIADLLRVVICRVFPHAPGCS